MRTLFTEIVDCDVRPFSGKGAHECERCPNPTKHELVFYGARRRYLYLCSDCLAQLIRRAEVETSKPKGQAS